MATTEQHALENPEQMITFSESNINKYRNDKSSVFSSGSSSGTISINDDDYLLVSHDKKEHVKQHELNHDDKKDIVMGSIIEIHESSVECEITSIATPMLINLPRELFPDDKIRYGLDFTLRMDEQYGVRKPVVEIYNPTIKELEEGQDKINALIKELIT